MTDINVDDLAQIIRQAHGNHALGAGALAEAILDHLSAPQIIRTVEELEALDPETIVQRRPQYPGQYSRTETAGDLAYVVRRWGTTTHLPAVVVTPASQVRAAREALEEA